MRSQPVNSLLLFMHKTLLLFFKRLEDMLLASIALMVLAPVMLLVAISIKLDSPGLEEYTSRHRVKPGITGLAQINGYRGETDTLEKIEKRVEFDLEYIENWSVWFDLYILFRTVPAVLFTREVF
jgi:lipopolysaccharide/colanic/teichoic acid biosynthesis glycosyltransferase